MWCLDPAGHVDGTDISQVLAVDNEANVLPVRRLQAVFPERGEHVIPNPKSAVVWNYSQRDENGDGKIGFEEEFHRSLSTPVIKDGILYIADFSGLFHCVNAKTGKVYWTYDMLAACWNSALLVDGKVFVGDEDGDVAIFRHSTAPRVALNAIRGRDGRTEFVPLVSRWNPDLIDELNMNTSVYMTPVVANDVLFIATKDMLYAISRGARSRSGDRKSEQTHPVDGECCASSQQRVEPPGSTTVRSRPRRYPDSSTTVVVIVASRTGHRESVRDAAR